MDFAAAKLRLDTPKKQVSKKIGHKLTLYWSLPTSKNDDTDRPRINLEFHDTEILTWYADGGVIIRTNGWYSRSTITNINEYSPRGWRLLPIAMHFSDDQKVAIVEKRTPTWDRVWAQPFSSGVRFYDDTGRRYPHGDPFHGIDAFDYVDAVKETTKLSVDAYLAGELRAPLSFSEESLETTYKSWQGQSENEALWTTRIRDIALAKTPSAPLMQFVIDRRASQSVYANEARKYWSDTYALTGKATTQAQKVAQIEYFMKLGYEDFRVAKNSKMYFATRSYLYESVEKFLLEEVGFEFFKT